MPFAFDHTFTIAKISPLVRRRVISPVELTRALLDRIAALQPLLNAFITITPDLALKQARKAEKEIMRGVCRGPLHGVPICLKDLFCVRGIRTTAGSAILADYVPEGSACVVDRLERAGAVLLGKTNLHEFAYGPTNVNARFGSVRNPWNGTRISGGSSGGSAAAVVAGMTLAALGTDTGGSIRIPAAACGCVGLKPTYGRVPLHGVIPLASSLDHVGPLCRCVEDAALMLEQIAGADVRDPFSFGAGNESFSSGLRRGCRRLRIGIPRQYFWNRIQQDIRRRVRNAVRVLERNGAEVREVDFTCLGETGGLAAEITRAEALLYHWPWLQKQPADYGADVRLRLEGSGAVSSLSYLHAQERRRLYAGEFARVMLQVHVLAMPTLPITAPGIGDPSVVIGKHSEDSRLALLRLTRPANLAGLPAISLPCGFSQDGLPIGLQLIGRRSDERTLLRVAYAYEQETSWHEKYPPVCSSPPIPETTGPRPAR
jgi:aspartyl-tRNA(Asn)/glutamyl-tRNA(Gln) amidotransferase subunit A